MKLVGFLFALFVSQAWAAAPLSGVEGPFVSFQDGKLKMTLKLQDAVHSAPHSFTMTEEKKSSVKFAPNIEDGGMLLELQLNLDELRAMETGETDLPLADGRPIPGVPGGSLKNALRLDRGHDFSTFHSPKSFGVVFPFNLNPGSLRDGHHWLNWKGKNIGMLSVVSGSADKKGYGMIFLRYAALFGNAELMKEIKRTQKSGF